MKEIWVTLPDNPNYKISTAGSLYSIKRNKLMKPKIDRYGYYSVGLRYSNNRVFTTIHRLVAKTFIPNPNNKPQVNHIDCDKLNNNVSNLEWVTVKENIAHTHKMGRNANINGSKNPMAKLTDIDVWNIRFMYPNLSNYFIAKLYNVSDETIRRIRIGNSWKYITYKAADNLY